jgi:beta-N-acetylhexosaminidase
MDNSIGQLIWGFIGAEDRVEPAVQAARDGRLGGIWLLRSEMRSPSATASLINRLQDVSPLPLLIGVDAEAGLGLVMVGATELPTAMALGATGDTELTSRAAVVTASEARACGINAIASPVLDVNINPANPIINTRSFGGRPEVVGRHGVAFLQGVEGESSPGAGVIPIAKHFPGHGDAHLDSHLHLETLNHSRERLEAVEFEPFRQVIAARVPMIMTAHVAYPALDPEPGVPATISRPILTDLLRGELGFDGAIVTDCMNMHAIANNFDGRDAAIRAVRAGCDLVLTDDWEGAYEAVSEALADGRLSQDRVGDAAAHVRHVKELIFGKELAHPAAIEPARAAQSVARPENEKVAVRIAEASITLVSGELTPPPERPLVLATRMDRWFGPSSEEQLQAILANAGWAKADVMMVDSAPGDSQIDEARRRAQASGGAALLHFNRVQSFDPSAVATGSRLVKLAEELAGAGVPPTVVSLGSPYALPLFRTASATLCSYSTCDASLRATLDVLMGRIPAGGKLPVELEPMTTPAA